MLAFEPRSTRNTAAEYAENAAEDAENGRGVTRKTAAEYAENADIYGI